MRLLRYQLLTCMLLISAFAFSQTEEEILEIQKQTNVKRLLERSNAKKAEYDKEQKRLEIYAKQHGWPQKKLNKNGGEQHLVGISNNQPVYIEALDTKGNITVGANKVHTGGILGLNVNGEGMTAGIWDIYPVKTSHKALQNRVMIGDSVYFDSTNTAAYTSDNIHATGMVGQILATDAYDTSTNKAGGIAPKANARSYTYVKDVIEANAAAANGLLASNHSYGQWFGTSEYNATARDFDDIMYDAPYYISVWSCGNNNASGFDQLNNNSTSKNGLSVASIDEITTYTGPSSAVRSFYSSLGPSDDYRIKPDITGSGSDARVPRANISNNNMYVGSTGTSVVSPTVTGGVLLLQQHYNNVNQHFMRASTAKGVILHSAREAGPNPGPDITFGWGVLNIDGAANIITNDGGKSLILEDYIANNDLFSRDFVASGAEPLIATISWTDLPGTVVNNNVRTAQLVNNLDLRLSSNGTTFLPWKLDTANVTGPALQGDNNRDNIEKIEIPNPAAGQTYRLAVSHKGSLVGSGQKFSLIVTGLQECVANRTILTTVDSSSLDQQQASATIVAQNVINNGGKAIYHAADEIVLKDGFTGIAGSQFRAYLEGCTTDYNARTAAVERTVVTYPTTPQSVEKTELPENAVYPNPGTGVFRVKLDGIPSGKVEVVAGDGKAMFNKSFKNQSELEVDIKNSTPGIYILRVVSDQKVLTKKIVKK